MRTLLLTAVVASLALPAPTSAADFAKYLPENATVYAHIRTKNLFTADVVRKTIPMVFDKYGDHIIALAGLAKQFNPNPNAPFPSDEQIKMGIEQLKDPKVIAQGFDAAKDFAPEFVITGNPDEDPESTLFLIKTDEGINAEAVEGVVQLINLGAQGQVKIKKVGKAKAALFEVSLQQPPVTFFAAIPEGGLIIIGAKRDGVEAVAKGKEAKIDAQLKTLIGKRNDKDFIFAAGVKGKGDERETFVSNLVLDKDISGKFVANAASTEKAKEIADKVNETIGEAVEKLKDQLGDGAKGIKAELDKIKAKQDGKTVTLEGKLPGTALEKLLTKD